MKCNVRAYEVTMIVHAAPDATTDTVLELIGDLTWVGGHRDPINDPAFEGLKPSKIRIKRMKDLDKKETK
jgi:hypothetical protein